MYNDFNNPFQPFSKPVSSTSGDGSGILWGVMVGLMFWGWLLFLLIAVAGILGGIALAVFLLFTLGRGLGRVFQYCDRRWPFPTFALSIAAIIFGAVFAFNRGVLPAIAWMHAHPAIVTQVMHGSIGVAALLVGGMAAFVGIARVLRARVSDGAAMVVLTLGILALVIAVGVNFLPRHAAAAAHHRAATVHSATH